MSVTKHPAAIVAAEAAPKARQSTYPEPFVSRVAGRLKRPLGDVFGLSNFGVNLTRLAPGAISALYHAHSKQDEFIYVIAGKPKLRTAAGETTLSPGMCAGFRAGSGEAHHLVNDTNEDAIILEVGDRTSGDSVTYPDDDIEAVLGPDGAWQFRHKTGAPY